MKKGHSDKRRASRRVRSHGEGTHDGVEADQHRHRSIWLWPWDRMRSFSRRRPITTFIGGVCLLMGAFYTLYTPQWDFDLIGQYFLPWNLRMHAELSGGVLRLLGNEITVANTSVISPRFSMQIVRGCDALEPTALFLSACLAFPVARFRKKLLGMAVGVLCLEITNVVRMVTLYYVGVHWPQHFQMMHLEVWQATFIALAVAYWAAWAIWASKRPTVAMDADDARV